MTKDEAIAVRPGMMVQFVSFSNDMPALVIEINMINGDVCFTTLMPSGDIFENTHRTWFKCAVGQQQ